MPAGDAEGFPQAEEEEDGDEKEGEEKAEDDSAEDDPAKALERSLLKKK